MLYVYGSWLTSSHVLHVFMCMIHALNVFMLYTICVFIHVFMYCFIPYITYEETSYPTCLLYTLHRWSMHDLWLVGIYMFLYLMYLCVLHVGFIWFMSYEYFCVLCVFMLHDLGLIRYMYPCFISDVYLCLTCFPSCRCFSNICLVFCICFITYQYWLCF